MYIKRKIFTTLQGHQNNKKITILTGAQDHPAEQVIQYPQNAYLINLNNNTSLDGIELLSPFDLNVLAADTVVTP